MAFARNLALFLITSASLLTALAAEGASISRVRVDFVSHTTARIQWDTDVAVTASRVLYDTVTPPTRVSTQLKTTPATTSVGYTIGGLSPSTRYFFKACSTGSDNVEFCSPPAEFTTSMAPPDRFRPPSLPMNAPMLPRMPTIDGTTFTVSDDCSNFQSLIRQAAAIPGSQNHQILIAPTTRCVGNYELPARAGTGWIIVRSAAVDTQLPAEGVRVSTTIHAGAMPVISALTPAPNGTGSAFFAYEKTSRWRFVGLQITAEPGVRTALVWMTHGSAADIIFDRDIFYSIQDTTYGIIAGGDRGIIANCWMLVVRPGTMTIGIAVTLAQGLTVDNNYIDAPGISLFGEEDGIAGTTGPLTADIRVTRNVFEWDKAYLNTTNDTRQQLEFKAGERIFIDGNIFRSEWTEGVTGGFTNAMIFTPRNGVPGGTAFDNRIRDVTITNNILYDQAGGINIGGAQTPNTQADVPASQRFLIQNNLFYDISGYKGQAGKATWGSPFDFFNALEDIVIDHNTVFDPRGKGPWILSWLGTPGSGVRVTNNILGQNFTGGYGGIRVDTERPGQIPLPSSYLGTNQGGTTAGQSFDALARAAPGGDATTFVRGNLILPGVTDTTDSANYLNPSYLYSPSACAQYWSDLPGNRCAGSGAATATQVFASVRFAGPLTAASGFTLTDASPFKGIALDGSDPGVDAAQLLAHTRQTDSGAWGIGAYPTPFGPTLDWPSTLPISGQVKVSWDPSLVVTNVHWAFTPLDSSQLDAAASSGSGTISRAGMASFSSLAGSVRPADHYVTVGRYAVTVQLINGASVIWEGGKGLTLVNDNLAGLKVYPNPWRANKSSARRIRFEGLTVGTSVKIFTVSGHQIYDVRTDGPFVDWDVRTNAGEPAASGIYLYLVEAGSSRARGKLAVLR